MQQHLLAIFFLRKARLTKKPVTGNSYKHAQPDYGRELISRQSSVLRINIILTPSYSQRTALNPEKGSQMHQNKKEHIPGKFYSSYHSLSSRSVFEEYT